MAFGLDLGFASEKSETTTKFSRQQDIDRQKTEREEATKATVEEQTEQERTTLLDPETQALLRNLVRAVGGATPSGEASSELAAGIAGRATGADEFFSAQIAPILAEARRRGTEEVTRLFTELSQTGGSSLDTLVRSGTAKAVGDLESQLAATGGQLAIESREAGTRELQTALQALTGAGTEQTSNLVRLIEQLRGATAETERVTTGRETETLQALNTLNEIVTSLTTGRSKSESGSSGFSFGISI